MSNLTINISCCLCEKKHKTTANVPDTWAVNDEIDIEDGFCPDHALIDEWKSAQCPGCVSDWRDCEMWNGFAYERYHHNMHETMNEKELMVIKTGTCPRRVNGTFGVFGGRQVDINLSSRAETKSGAALVKAIKAYWRKYPKCAPGYDPTKAVP